MTDIEADDLLTVRITGRISSNIFQAILLEKNGEAVPEPKRRQGQTPRQKTLPAGKKDKETRKKRPSDLARAEFLVQQWHDLHPDFPEPITQALAQVSDSISADEYARRKDRRDLPFVTIDGCDARDFDDAVCVQKTDKGWTLFVAIADVSFFVPLALRRKKISLDKEACQRGNSFYFPSSVVPMLPPRLSTDLLSLKPFHDRLAVLCEIALSAAGSVQETSFYEAVISSRARLTYDEVKAVFFDQDAHARAGFLARPFGQILFDMLDQACTVAGLLLRLRDARGRLHIERPEPNYVLDHAGNLVRMTAGHQHMAHKVIEEFMLTANEACAAYLTKKELPFLYRVHPAPSSLDCKRLAQALQLTAPYCLPSEVLTGKRELSAEDIQSILSRARASKESPRISELCLRALPKAYYSPYNLGHFGLASECYCHFTSPIRRYADLTVHRALKYALSASHDPLCANKRLLHIAQTLNQREKEAVTAEREMQKYCSCLLLKGHEGESFRCSVTGMCPKGLFVRVCESLIEGFLQADFLKGGPFVEESTHQLFFNQKSRMGFTVGDELPLVLLSVRNDLLRINFAPDYKQGFAAQRLPETLLRKSKCCQESAVR